MAKGISVLLSGAASNETARALAARIAEFGRAVEWVDSQMAGRLAHAAGLACLLLARNGAIVIVTDERVRPEGPCLSIPIDANDTPDFAAEKIIDELARNGILSLDTVAYTPEEEEQIRKRLADLGYID